jgi:hypothetical protein
VETLTADAYEAWVAAGDPRLIGIRGQRFHRAHTLR